MNKALLLLTIFAAQNISSTDQSQQKTVIFSFNTLFLPNEAKIEQHIREKVGLWYGLRLLLSGIPTAEEIKNETLTLLHEMPLLNITIPHKTWQTEYVPWEGGAWRFPPILQQYQITSDYHDEELFHHAVNRYIIQKKSIKKSHKPILEGVMDFLFSDHMNRVVEPIQPMIEVAKKLRNKGYIIMLTAGVPGHAWDNFLAAYPQAQVLKELFTEKQRYISGKEHFLPTSRAMFEKIMDDHQLDPHACVVIGRYYHDLDYPRSIGMNTLIFDQKTTDFNRFYHELTTTLGEPL